MNPYYPELDLSLVTHQSSRWLSAFFDSLYQQQYPLKCIHLWLRDNDSTDETLSWIRTRWSELEQKFASVTLLQGPNVGFGRGHNSNIAQGCSPFVLVCNPDLEFEQRTLTVLLDQAQEDEHDTAAWECRQKPYEHPKHYSPVTGAVSWVSGACVLLRRQALEQVGGFDPRLFLYGEDVELSYRLIDRGWRLRYVPKAAVWHHAYAVPEQVKPSQLRGSALANALIRCRYGSPGDVLQGGLQSLLLPLLPQRYRGQRLDMLKNLVKLLWLAPCFLLSRKRSSRAFPFRRMDYEFVRDGAFWCAPQPGKVGEPEPLVSILVRTTPDREGWLEECLQCVIRQTYPRIELVVVEDGGDSAQARLEALRASAVLESVRYVALNKVGRCKAGNRALQEATGAFLGFLDDDDLFYADHVENLARVLSASPELGGVYGLAFQVKTLVLSSSPLRYEEKLHQVIHRQPFERAILWHHNFMPIQAVLFRRELYEQYGGFCGDLENLEDWNLWVRYTQSRDFMLVPKVTSLYRVPADEGKALERQQSLDR